MHLLVTAEGDPFRDTQEQFVRQLFAAEYGAEIEYFLPSLLSIGTDREEMVGVLGVNPAADAALFLEQYLDHSIERTLTRLTGDVVERNGIVEVGNLAAASAGGARVLIVMLTAYLRGAGYHWVTFTARPSLINSFRRLGIPLHLLAEADSKRLKGGAEGWGNYYEDTPMVVAARVREGFEVLDRAAMAERLKMTMVWGEAYSSGCRLRVG